jgi:anaerobic ribonucleoside-triphosphate reductase activating protein
MYIDRILAPIITLGPGKRLVIWTKGCSKRCKNCANPELWSIEGARNYSVKEIIQIIKNVLQSENITGITITGGDPLEQKDELLLLIEEISLFIDDILIYTGFTYDDIEKSWDERELQLLQNNISVLIDGPYIEEQNIEAVVLRGSMNQKLYYFKPEYESKYIEYMRNGRQIQNIYMGERLISVGIHGRKGDMKY